VHDAPRARGTLFHGDLQAITGHPAAKIEDGLWDGVARGLLTADGFAAVRSLLHLALPRRGDNALTPPVVFTRSTRRLASRGGGPLDAAAEQRGGR
jgi:hypothetical protein